LLMKSKATCVCMVCDEQFSNITDHMLHYMKAHDEGFKEQKDRRKRSVTCGKCLGEIKTADLICACGHKHWSLLEQAQ
jgi:hypothetical protein